MKEKSEIQNLLKKGIAFLGECMVEISGNLPTPLKLGFAGDTFNSAAYLSRLIKAKGGKVEYLTGLGTDMFSNSIKAYLNDSGVGSNYIRTIKDRRPGLYFIETASTGERHFHYWRNEAAAKFFLDEISPDELAEEFGTFGGVYFSGISIAVLTQKGRSTFFEALKRSKEFGVKVFFDSNYRPVLWESKAQAQKVFSQFMELADIAMLTDGDVMDLFDVSSEEILSFCQKFNIPELVIKRGEQPCLIKYEGKTVSISASHVDHVVDTTAAGDSFNAAYLAARLLGSNPSIAAQCGHLLAARVIQYHGAILDLEKMPDVMSIIEANDCSFPLPESTSAGK